MIPHALALHSLTRVTADGGTRAVVAALLATYLAEGAVRTTEPSATVIHLVPDVDRDPVS